MLFVKFVTICVLHRLESLSGSRILQEDVTASTKEILNSIGRQKTTEKHIRDNGVVPFGHAISVWIKLSRDLAELGEDLVYDVFEFFQTLWAHLRDVVHHHHRVYTVSLLGLLPQDVTQKL